MKNEDLLLKIICGVVIFVFIIFFIWYCHIQITEIFKIDTLIIFTALSAVGTLTLAFMTYQNIKRQKELQEKSFWNSIDINIIRSGTINIMNMGEFPIRIDKISQSIIPIYEVYGEDFKTDDSFFKLMKESINEKGDEIKQIFAEEFKKNKNEFFNNKIWRPQKEFESDLLLNPKNKYQVIDSLSYNLPGGNKKYYAYLLLMRINLMDINNKKKSSMNHIWRYSFYSFPEGWVRMG